MRYRSDTVDQRPDMDLTKQENQDDCRLVDKHTAHHNN